MWNREELYAEIWKEPMVKLATRYGISSVMLGKVCRKLQIPVPGRGYWVKKEFGKPVKEVPLPEAKNIPVVRRFKEHMAKGATIQPMASPKPEPSDQYYKSIREMESRTIPVEPGSRRQQLVVAAGKALRHGRPDSRGILERDWEQPPCLDIRVTKKSLDRALMVANGIVRTLEREKFPITVERGKHSTSVSIFGFSVRFAITEKVREVGRREVKEYSWTRTVIDYEGGGMLEFRAGDYAFGRKIRDTKKNSLEQLIPQCVGALMREARANVFHAEEQKRLEIERRKKEQEMAELAQQISEEENKVKDFEGWVDAWIRARQMRDFIAALEKVWTEEKIDLSPESPKGKRIMWMKQQADREDPMVASPPSILDRKKELRHW